MKVTVALVSEDQRHLVVVESVPLVGVDQLLLLDHRITRRSLLMEAFNLLSIMLVARSLVQPRFF